MAPRSISKSKRFNEIFRIMIEHRLTSLVKDLAELARDPTALQAPPVAGNGAGPASAPLRVRRLLEDLGPTFIKIGQLLGTRPDLIPKAFVEEFKKMYDSTTPTPFPQVRKVIEAELGRAIDDVFSEISETPIASASIAQVHRARLRGGQVVALKVQHPGAEQRMRTDFEILRGIVQFTERVFSATHVYQPSKHLDEIRAMLNKELDFRNEVKVQAQFEQNFQALPEVKIPHVHQGLSTRRLVVMDFIDGTKFHERHLLKLSAEEQRNLARIITHAMAQQIFVDRLFHADPSPGNLLVLGPNQICFLDFGAVGQVTRRRSRLILDFLTSLRTGNHDEASRAVLDLCEPRGEPDPKRFQYDLERILDYYETESRTPADPVLLEKVVALGNKHGLVLPSDFMLITRALYQFEGMCHELDPEYDLVEVLTPFIQRTMRDRFLSPDLHPEQLAMAAQDLGRLFARLPTHVDRLLGQLEKGQLTQRIDLVGLADYKRHQRSVAFFIGFSVLVATGVLAATLGFALGGEGGLRTGLFLAGAGLLLWALVLLVANARGNA